MSVSSDRIDALMEDHAFFGGVTPEERVWLLDLSRMRQEEAGTLLFQHGDR
jgi:CRP/FNR family transcriptional regulator